MRKISFEQMVERINAAPPKSRVDLAEKLLERYEGDDKELITPEIMEMAAVGSEVEAV